jgi:hypothetical protein
MLVVANELRLGFTTTSTTSTSQFNYFQDKDVWWFLRHKKDAANFGFSTSAVDYDSAALRAARFPSVAQRVRLYMGDDWYLPPCANNNHNTTNANGLVRYQRNGAAVRLQEVEEGRVLLASKTPQATEIFTLDPVQIDACAANKAFRYRNYCKDLRRYVLDPWYELLSQDQQDADGQPPLVVKIGDVTRDRRYGHVRIPVLTKFRSVQPQQAPAVLDTNATCGSGPTRHNANNPQSIVWLMTLERHFGGMFKVACHDVEWHDKLPRIVFRGALTGTGTFSPHAAAVDNCRAMLRCRLVYQTSASSSSLINAKLSESNRFVPDVVHNVSLVGERLSIAQLLQYKGIIMLEGNDVSSGLKWALASQSVVIMPPPTKTSWAMEELLQPWVHYIPLRPDLADVEQQAQWMVEHDMEARRIAVRGALWMSDLMLHPEAASDQRQVFAEVLQRYRAHFVAANLSSLL